MKKITLLLITLLPYVLYAQPSLKNIRQKSYQSLAFRISAAAAEKFIIQDSIPVDNFINQIPSFVFNKDSVHTDILPIGHYVLISIDGTEVISSLIGITNLVVYPINNQHNIQIDIRKQDGGFVDNAKVWVNNEEAVYNAKAKSYWTKQRKIETGLVKVFAPNDTTYTKLEASTDYGPSITKQRWTNFKITRTGRVITYLPKKIIGIFKKHRRYKTNTVGATGYVLFNQPKYKLTDTVKLKAYIVNRKGKQYKEKADLFLQYYARGQYYEQLLTHLSPVSPSSYVYAFPLSDTLASDIRYSVVFKTPSGKTLIQKSFSTEDYLLDEIGSYQLRTDRDNYYLNDTIKFYASAKDANGLSLLDGRAALILTTETIEAFYKDSINIPDTLLIEEKPLAAENETAFSIPTKQFPNAQLTIKATLVFKNSNNEQHKETRDMTFSPGAKELGVKSEADSVFATYLINGRSVAAKGTLKISGDNIERTVDVSFPAHLKVDPLADDYEFTLITGKDTLKQKADIPNYYAPLFTRANRQDTLGFILHNPYKIPISFIILDGDKVIDAGKDDNENITWYKVMSNKHKMYNVKWQYIWAGRAMEGRENIALLYKLLQINVTNTSTVYPGQRDTISIEVKDYKNRAAKGVNLAAVAYNSQFKKDIDVREPPYLVKYKNRPGIRRPNHETDDPYILKKYSLGQHQQWMQLFHLDTMKFYNILFPKTSPFGVVTPIKDFVPQLSVHVVKRGEPQEIYLLYVNRQLVYYNGVTDKMRYAFHTLQGYTQIGIRLFDKFIQIDSIYTQPFYKHDLVFSLDSLPPHSIVKEATDYWTSEERSLIENNIWQLDNNYKTNYGYVWQNDKVVKLNSNSKHFVGPFNRFDSLHFYASGDFDIHFKFEPGYEYNLSKQVERLEKKSIFPGSNPKIFLPKVASSKLTLGDTIVYPPTIEYPKNQASAPYIKLTDFLMYENKPGNGKLQFTIARDTVLKYVILYNKDTSFTNVVLNGYTRIIRNIKPGRYTLLLVDENFQAAEIKNLLIKKDQTLCIDTKGYPYKRDNELMKEIIRQSMTIAKPSVANNDINRRTEKIDQLPRYPIGNGIITGKVTDAKGREGIPGASVIIAGTTSGVSTNMDGSFAINNIKAGKYRIVIASVGYTPKEIQVTVTDGQPVTLKIQLSMSTQNLAEVVVTAYGTQKRRDMTGSIASIRGQELSSSLMPNSLQGRLAGVSVAGAPGNDVRIQIRGAGTISGENQPIYVIDGIIYNEMPPNIKPEMIQSIEVLKDAGATAIYGARASSGAIIITTGSKTLRNKFIDYAFWQPELFTNAEGKVSFEVVYPDNITGWEMYVLGMDKKRRMGKGVSFAKSYKPIMAQLSNPQFLIIGDTVQVIGKVSNYTNDNYSIQTKLQVNDSLLLKKDTLLEANASMVIPVTITANKEDTLRASNTLNTSTGFKDGEDRKIPVFKKGTEEANGAFYILQADTTVNFTPIRGGAPVEVYIQNNTLDMLLKELDHLKQYPYYCMEQIASKLKGLSMEQQIRDRLKQPFKNEKEMNALLKKLQDNQLFDGGWSWWEKGKANLQISAYIVEALLQLREKPLVETNVRNGLLYLQNQLAGAKKDELLQILSTMSNANHAIDYKPYLSKINFDSLTQHQQWQWVKISQQQKLDYSKQLKSLIAKRVETFTGGVHWGTENYRWYSNAAATTVLAYEVLENEKEYQYLLPEVIQYFLETRQKGFWRNTVESASITSAILPYTLKSNQSFNQPASIKITGDTSVTVNSYPYSAKLSNKNFHDVSVNKAGGGITYVTLYQNWWNEKPTATTDKFVINTYFERNGQKLLNIAAGEKVKMIVNVNALKDADYVMIEVPIPAGCTYSAKKQDDWKVHKEFYKNKVAIFAEALPKGVHQFEIELEPRYKGTFSLNPAKVELMYFPTFYGRNEMSKIEIK
jgi:alpha-2-macroglobulin